jgi:hypothetical protein
VGLEDNNKNKRLIHQKQIQTIAVAVKTDNFQSPDYFNLDELLTEEHLLIEIQIRQYVKKEISPIIENSMHKMPVFRCRL